MSHTPTNVPMLLTAKFLDGQVMQGKTVDGVIERCMAVNELWDTPEMSVDALLLYEMSTKFKSTADFKKALRPYSKSVEEWYRVKEREELAQAVGKQIKSKDASKVKRSM